MLVGSAKQQVCQKVDTKAGLNLQENFRGNACEQKWGGSWERLREASEYNAGLTPNEERERERERERRNEEREGGGWKHLRLNCSSNKSLVRTLGSPEAKAAYQRNSTSSRKGCDLVSFLYSVTESSWWKVWSQSKGRVDISECGPWGS